jgi:hypothetical protein
MDIVLEQVLHLGSAVVSVPEETLDLDVLLQILEDLDGLVGEAVKFGLREVESIVVPR